MKRYTIVFDVHDEIPFLNKLQYISRYAEYHVHEIDEGKDCPPSSSFDPTIPDKKAHRIILPDERTQKELQSSTPTMKNPHAVKDGKVVPLDEALQSSASKARNDE